MFRRLREELPSEGSPGEVISVEEEWTGDWSNDHRRGQLAGNQRFLWGGELGWLPEMVVPGSSRYDRQWVYTEKCKATGKPVLHYLSEAMPATVCYGFCGKDHPFPQALYLVVQP